MASEFRKVGGGGGEEGGRGGGGEGGGEVVERGDGGGVGITAPDGSFTPLDTGKSVSLKETNGQCWDFTLLHLHIPEARSGIADEKEPQADWALRNRGQC